MANGNNDNQPQLRLTTFGPVAERFERFHRDNPRVYRTLVTLARQWISVTGRNKVGLQALYERARWEIAIETTDADFKLNNSYPPYYARLIMTQEPDLDGIFNLRRSTADEWVDVLDTVPDLVERSRLSDFDERLD